MAATACGSGDPGRSPPVTARDRLASVAVGCHGPAGGGPGRARSPAGLFTRGLKSTERQPSAPPAMSRWWAAGKPWRCAGDAVPARAERRRPGRVRHPFDGSASGSFMPDRWTELRQSVRTPAFAEAPRDCAHISGMGGGFNSLRLRPESGFVTSASYGKTHGFAPGAFTSLPRPHRAHEEAPRHRQRADADPPGPGPVVRLRCPARRAEQGASR